MIKKTHQQQPPSLVPGPFVLMQIEGNCCPETRKGQCGPGPQKCKFSFSLARIAEVAGTWESQFLKNEHFYNSGARGNLAMFFGEAKYISDGPFCCSAPSIQSQHVSGCWQSRRGELSQCLILFQPACQFSLSIQREAG